MCEVCQQPVISNSTLPPEIHEKVYRPGADEVKVVELKFEDEPTSEEVEASVE